MKTPQQIPSTGTIDLAVLVVEEAIEHYDGVPITISLPKMNAIADELRFLCEDYGWRLSAIGGDRYNIEALPLVRISYLVYYLVDGLEASSTFVAQNYTGAFNSEAFVRVIKGMIQCDSVVVRNVVAT